MFVGKLFLAKGTFIRASLTFMHIGHVHTVLVYLVWCRLTDDGGAVASARSVSTELLNVLTLPARLQQHIKNLQRPNTEKLLLSAVKNNRCQDGEASAWLSTVKFVSKGVAFFVLVCFLSFDFALSRRFFIVRAFIDFSSFFFLLSRRYALSRSKMFSAGGFKEASTSEI